MADYNVINSTDAALATGGSTAAARGEQVAATLTDANLATLGALSGVAIIKASATAAQKKSIAAVLLDVSTADLDLSTAALREAYRLKRGVAEGQALTDAIGSVA